MKASLLIVLVVLLAHLSSQKQLPLAREQPGSLRASDVVVGTDGTDTRAKAQVAEYCSIAFSNQSLSQSCPVTALSCEDHLAKTNRAAAEVSTLNLESQAAPPSRPTRTNCMESVAIKSSTVELRANTLE